MCKSDEKSAAMMRVNHSGEVCAQALYKAQASFARDLSVQEFLNKSSDEEALHLEWTSSRLRELRGAVSDLNPVWYFGAYGIGSIAALAGDRYSLGFLAETERQVVVHLSEQMVRLPVGDHQSRAVIRAMRKDESGHAEQAEQFGGVELPLPLRLLMKGAAKIMTSIAYRR